MKSDSSASSPTEEVCNIEGVLILETALGGEGSLDFESQWGHVYVDRQLFELALTHKSYANEQLQPENVEQRVEFDNERLEFLGDAVLDLIMSEFLMKSFPNDPEGSLSKKRASLVNEESLSKIARELQLDQLIKLGKGELKTGGIQKPRILASTLEAMVGALFLDAGYGRSREVMARIFSPKIDELQAAEHDFQSDFKTRLQERTQTLFKTTPVYIIESQTGPDHDKTFEVSVQIDGNVFGRGVGRSKKAAEQNAAKDALESIK